ncbi:MAG: hypothetical protein AAGF12_10525 [Myxococcota bacterium]
MTSRIPIAIGLGWGLVLLLLGAVPSLRFLAEKEGPVEQLSHLVLIGGIVHWAVHGRRQRLRGVVLICLYLGVLLGEETDWGAVYGLFHTTGEANLHNRFDGHSYPLFGIPAAALLFATAFARSRSWLERWLEIRAGPSFAVAFFVLAAGSLGIAVAVPTFDTFADELTELGVYLLLAFLPISGPKPASDDRVRNIKPPPTL